MSPGAGLPSTRYLALTTSHGVGEAIGQDAPPLPRSFTASEDCLLCDRWTVPVMPKPLLPWTDPLPCRPPRRLRWPSLTPGALSTHQLPQGHRAGQGRAASSGHPLNSLLSAMAESTLREECISGKPGRQHGVGGGWVPCQGGGSSSPGGPSVLPGGHAPPPQLPPPQQGFLWTFSPSLCKETPFGLE